MNCSLLTHRLGFTCHPVGDGLSYVQSPLVLSFDGQLIGAYVQDIGMGRVRISDNSDTLFTAMTHGIAPNHKRASYFSELASQSGVTLSEDGELYATCSEELASYYIARFIEAASRIGNACDDMLVPMVSKFERQVATVLRKSFPKRVRSNVALVGASGHQLSFPIVLDAGTDRPTAIQTIGSGRSGKPNWASIYGAVGKMGDLKNAGDGTRRAVILQAGEPESIQQASIALAETAAVIIYSGDDARLAEALRAA